MEVMNPEDDEYGTMIYGAGNDGTISIDISTDVDDWTITDTSFGNLRIDWANITMPDTKWEAQAVGNDDELCISNYQARAHEDYPGLKQIWDEYVLMYKLVKGKEPGDEIL